MLTGIDHAVILVHDLAEAMETYRALGFQVVPGGEHPGGTHNALIAFRDGSYLELIAFQHPERPHEHRWYRFLRVGGGLVDFALGAEDVAAEARRLSERGLGYRGPVGGARRRPDGTEIAWRLALPPDDRTGELPFLIDDVTPRDLRVPSGEATRHPAGAVGIQSILVAVRDLEEAASEYAALLDEAVPDMEFDQELEADTVGFPSGRPGQRIVLAYPTAPSSPLVEFIQQRGDGPYQLVLAAEGIEVERRLEVGAREGVRLFLTPEG